MRRRDRAGGRRGGRDRCDCRDSGGGSAMTLMNDEHQAERERLRPVLHDLRATPATVHWGYFDADLAPVLTVANGDIVRVEALTHHAGDAPELMMDAGITAIFDAIPAEDRNPGVHLMTGPIRVE